jgi:hypothetical protein
MRIKQALLFWTIVVALCFSVALTTSFAQEEGGGLSIGFGINKTFGMGGADEAGVAALVQYNLSSKLGIRAGLDFVRYSSNPYVVLHSEYVGDELVFQDEQFQPAGGSNFGINIAPAAVIYFGGDQFKPYVAAGATLGLGFYSFKYEDDISSTVQVTKVMNKTKNLFIDLNGLVGMEWAFHEKFGAYAELGLGLTVFERMSMRNETVHEATDSSGSNSELNESIEIDAPFNVKPMAAFGFFIAF